MLYPFIYIYYILPHIECAYKGGYVDTDTLFYVFIHYLSVQNYTLVLYLSIVVYINIYTHTLLNFMIEKLKY